MSGTDRDSASSEPRNHGRLHAFLPHAHKQSWTPNGESQALTMSSPVDIDASLEPPPSLMRHSNHSVPSLPSQQRPPSQSEGESVPSLPAFDPTQVLDQFSALRIGTDSPDAILRSGTPSSTRSATTSSHPHAPRHAKTLPGSPNYGRPIRALTENQAAPTPHGGQRQNTVPEEYQYGSGDASSIFSYDSTAQASQFYHPPGGYHQQAWSGSSYGGQQGYDAYQAAANSVLGVGPPPGGVYPQGNVAYGGGNPGPIFASQSTPYLGPPPSQYPSGASSSYRPSTSTEIEPRPSVQRSGTTASVSLLSQKTKAVDLNAPPYTKEYIDQYRIRIKGDPDPESHFLYAKYLIDAAKHIGADAKDQKTVKKYRDLLIAESLKVIRRLATQGEAYDEAQFFLANCYGTGFLGLQVDHERAYHLYLQAAKQNHAAASYRVAVCNEIGAGTRKEPPRAAAFYRKAASLGDTAAMYKLGMILLLGSLGETKNPREAISWLKRAAEQADEENPHALHELGLLHEMPNSHLVMHDPNHAKNLFTQAAQLGYTQSQFKLGQCYEYGTLGCPVDPRRSIAWYTKAAQKGNAEAELALSGWYLTGSEGVLKQSDSEAYLWARRAANKGLSKAEYAVGYYAEVGIGIKQDIEFSKRWYMRASAQGNKRAMNRLTEMKRMGNQRRNIARPTRQDANKDECVVS